MRRSDKWEEAVFHGLESYMNQVDEFYEYYNLKYSNKSNEMKRIVYVATDDETTIDRLKSKLLKFKFK